MWGEDMHYYEGPAGRGRVFVVALLTVFLCELPYLIVTLVMGLDNRAVLVGGIVAILTLCYFIWPVILRLLVNR